jgi:hypothetical protein
MSQCVTHTEESSPSVVEGEKKEKSIATGEQEAMTEE